MLASESQIPLWLGVVGLAPVYLLGVLWFVAAATIALKGEAVDKPNRMAQLYGYTVCLVTLIVNLITISSFLNAAFDRANPLQAEYSFGASLTSFEAYRATYGREREMMGRSESTAPDTASEATLRRRYDALIADRLATTRYRTAKSLVTSGLLLVIALTLFAVHWRWVRRLNGVVGAAG